MSTLSAALLSNPAAVHHPPTIHASIRSRAGLLLFRDAVPGDAGAYVNYWHHSGDEVKKILGIDPRKLGTPDDSRKRFFKMIRVPGTDQPDVIFTITLNDVVIGYTNINRHGLDDNYVHLHTYRSAVRSALGMRGRTRQTKTGAGLAAVMIGPIIALHLGLFPVRRLVLQTRTINQWINHALDLYMSPAETKYIFNPPGLAAPGECHIRHVRHDDVLWMQSRAEFLANPHPQFRDINTRPSGQVDQILQLSESA